jgi:hypothetical protein
MLISLPTFILAGDDTRKGTAGAEQLLVPVGAQSIATGGAFISNVSGVEAIYYHPAGLSSMEGSEAMFNYMNYVADINVSYFALGTTIGVGSFALTYKSFDFGDIPITTFSSPDGTGQTYSPNYSTLGLTYSNSITDRVSAGVTVKLISETIMNSSATGAAIDFGVQYKFDQNLSLGISLKNIGSNMSYSGEDLKQKTSVPNTSFSGGNGTYEIDTEEFQIPSYFEMSLGYNFIFDNSSSLLLGSTFRNNNNLEDLAKVGMQYNFQNLFFLRGGYNYQLENTSEATYNYSLGAGINYEMVDGIEVKFDYAFRNAEEFPTDNHIFTLTLGIK